MENKSIEHTKSAGVILETTDKKLAFQQRDDKPDIVDAGKVGIFGGGVKNGEMPETAAVREIKEELSIFLKKKDLLLFPGYPKIKNKKKVWIYVAKNINASNLKIKEGKGIVFISREDIDKLDKYNLSEHARELIKKYFNLK